MKHLLTHRAGNLTARDIHTVMVHFRMRYPKDHKETGCLLFTDVN